MERYNMYEHLQEDLFNLLQVVKAQAHQASFGSIVQTDSFIEYTKALVNFTAIHIQLKEIHIYSPMVNWEPDITEEINARHALMQMKGEHILRLISIFNKLCFEKRRRRMALHIKLACLKLVTITEEYLAHEKRTITPVLWKYYNDYDLRNICQKITRETENVSVGSVL